MDEKRASYEPVASEEEPSSTPRTPKPRHRLFAAVTAALALAFLVSLQLSGSIHSCVRHAQARASQLSADINRNVARAAPPSLLEDFQVYPPVLTVTPGGVLEITDGSSNASVQVIPSTKPTCQDVLMVHSFVNSYGAPFVGQYTPPSCSFNRVSWNLTVESKGVQYDRLGTVWLGNVELFRTSTAEPSASGIIWTYIKDMTNFLPLFKKKQTLIFDLGNIVDPSLGLTGAYNVTLTASYFTAGDSIEPADMILPVSSRMASKGQPSLYTLPPDTASNDLTFPRNVKKAVFTVAATGQANEEFWWSNVPQSAVGTFPGLDGYSPFREVQLYIDNMLAGVAWPYPIIFTGGVVPGLWRPVVGIDAFDLKEDEIDITPFLPLLCDGKAHNFTIRVSGLNDNGKGKASLSETTDSDWLVSGKAFLWLDEPGHITTGSGPHSSLPAPSFNLVSVVGKDKTGKNESLNYNVQASRTLSIRSTIKTSTGSSTVFWNQTRTYSNTGNYTDYGNVEINTQQTNGYDSSSSGYARTIDYPLYSDLVATETNSTLLLVATLNREKNVRTLGSPVFPTGLEAYSSATKFHDQANSYQGSSLATSQSGHARYLANQTSGSATSYGTGSQNMTFNGIKVASGPGSQFPATTGNYELFSRFVKTKRSKVLTDQEMLIDRPIGHDDHHGVPSIHDFVIKRLPGKSRPLHMPSGGEA